MGRSPCAGECENRAVNVSTRTSPAVSPAGKTDSLKMSPRRWFRPPSVAPWTRAPRCLLSSTSHNDRTACQRRRRLARRGSRLDLEGQVAIRGAGVDSVG